MVEETILYLQTENNKTMEVQLHPHIRKEPIEDINFTSKLYVFSDHSYSAQLITNEKNVQDVEILLNGQKIGVNYSPESGLITFCDMAYGNRIFMECYGYVQLTLIYIDSAGKEQIKESDYMQVMVRKGRQNDAVSRMMKYIYKENAVLLNTKRILPQNFAGLKEGAKKTIQTHLSLLSQIALIYEENYRYFKMNSRFNTITKEKVDRFEKTRFFSSNILRYIVQHPEELQRVPLNSGLRIGRFRYQPTKTLIEINAKNYDIYENQFVVGFLLFLLEEIKRIEEEIENLLLFLPQNKLEIDQYIASSIFIYEQTERELKIILGDLNILHAKFINLYNSYAKLFEIKNIKKCTKIPKLTPIFKSIPQYYHIFTSAVNWFSKGAFSLDEEKFMISFMKISSLYEFYVLTKMINFFQSQGYHLHLSEKFIYPYPGKFYENTECNNLFVFKPEAGTSTITLYYQPVIYNGVRPQQQGMELYRNTSISYPNSQEIKEKKGGYYTPDFIIKYEYEGVDSIKYIIGDAKFSRLKTIKTIKVAELVYKYLFSVSPVHRKDQIVGLCIFSGQSDEEKDKITNIYNFELREETITPRADIITLTENETGNDLLHETLFKNSIGRYITNSPQKTLIMRDKREGERVYPYKEINEGEKVRTEVEDKKEQASETPENAAKIVSQAKDSLSLTIDALQLNKDLERSLTEAGYRTIKDLLPNQTKADLKNNLLINRQGRREIEAKLKKKRIYLRD